MGHKRLSQNTEIASLSTLPYPNPMDVILTSDQRALARQAIESGRLHREEDVVQEALSLWEDRERHRIEFLASLDEARKSLARGEGRPITEESMQNLSAAIKERGRARIAAELSSSK